MTKSLSIVIPAYNEERHIAACLDSIATQTSMPDEVIVVDNNSTDQTVQIARRYPFVKIVRESEQGLIPTRNHGFRVAHGDVLARINADVILEPDWVAIAKAHFDADAKLGGLTGPAATCLIPPHFGRVRLISRWYLLRSDAYFRVRVMWGANMVIRASAWREINTAACSDDTIVHEDQDLSLLLAGNGWSVAYDKHLLVTTDEYSYFLWPKLKEYMQRRWRTKAVHQDAGTLSHANARILPGWYCLAMSLITAIPFDIFIVASFLWWHMHSATKVLRDSALQAYAAAKNNF